MKVRAPKGISAASHEGVEYAPLSPSRLLSADGKEPADFSAAAAEALESCGCKKVDDAPAA